MRLVGWSSLRHAIATSSATTPAAGAGGDAPRAGLGISAAIVDRLTFGGNVVETGTDDFNARLGTKHNFSERR